MRQSANGAVLAAGLQPQDPQGLRDNHPLLGVVWGRNTLKDLEAGQGSLTTGSLVGDHTADSLVEDAGRGAEVEWAAVPVVSGTLAKVGVVLDCIIHQLLLSLYLVQLILFFHYNLGGRIPFRTGPPLTVSLLLQVPNSIYLHLMQPGVGYTDACS